MSLREELQEEFKSFIIELVLNEGYVLPEVLIGTLDDSDEEASMHLMRNRTLEDGTSWGENCSLEIPHDIEEINVELGTFVVDDSFDFFTDLAPIDVIDVKGISCSCGKLSGRTVRSETTIEEAMKLFLIDGSLCFPNFH